VVRVRVSDGECSGVGVRVCEVRVSVSGGVGVRVSV
jgi:hypothetical protein